MKAGFAKACITPPIGTAMLGFWSRDRQDGCQGVHDDIFARAVYLEHEGEAALIMAFDLCFLGREEADRFKGAIGRRLHLAPWQILLNSSHSHVGPAVPSAAFADYLPPDTLYTRELEAATLRAACAAREAARNVTVWTGATRSALPMNRRRREADGRITLQPNPDGVVCDHLPVCLLKDDAGKPVCLLFSVSCHPSTISGFQISADYPGAATKRLDEHLGAECSLFLQGCGGDAKPSVIGEGVERWRRATWEDVDRAGGIVADEVIALLDDGLSQTEPQIACTMLEMDWPLGPPMDRSALEAELADPETHDLRRLWAKRMLELLDRGAKPPTAADIICHGVKIADGLRLAALEGEAVAELGRLMLDAWEGGITFPLSYSNGAGLYLVTTPMLAEGGYEPESWFEYGWPAPLAGGQETILRRALGELQSRGID